MSNICAHIYRHVLKKNSFKRQIITNTSAMDVPTIYSNEAINDELLAMKADKVKQPLASKLKVVIFSNAIMRLIWNKNHQGQSFSLVKRIINEHIDIDDLFEGIDFKHEEQDESISHKKEFIALLIQTYMELKSQKIGQKITNEKRGELIRYRNKRSVILCGQ